MFATLDDIGGAVEMLVFGKALSENEAALVVDEVVLVKGRVDHKEAGKTCIVVQTVERFAPSAQEIEQAKARSDASARSAVTMSEAVHLRVDATHLDEGTIDDLKRAIADYPGSAEVVLELAGSSGTRRLRLGDGFRVANTPTLRAELEHALAAARLAVA
jgi:DNA polymerase-3 subunit alpha